MAPCHGGALRPVAQGATIFLDAHIPPRSIRMTLLWRSWLSEYSYDCNYFFCTQRRNGFRMSLFFGQLFCVIQHRFRIDYVSFAYIHPAILFFVMFAFRFFLFDYIGAYSLLCLFFYTSKYAGCGRIFKFDVVLALCF
jgi:hypothetical protein